MKPKITTSILLFISSYSPLFWIMCINDFNMTELWFEHPKACITMFIISLSSISLVFLLIYNIKKEIGINIEISSIRNTSSDIINYSIPYVISFMGISFNDIIGLISFGLFMVLLMIMSIKSDILFLNPILLIFNYRFFDVEYKYQGNISYATIVTRIRLHKFKEINIKHIGNKLYLETNNKLK